MFGSGFPVLLAFLVQTRWLLRTIRLHHLVLVSISHHVFASLLSNFCFAASMGDSYDPGYEQDYSFATDHASLINNMIDSNCFDLSPQQASVNQDNLLCGTRSRHDSVNSRPSPRMPRYITGQHQAENQPCAVIPALTGQRSCLEQLRIILCHLPVSDMAVVHTSYPIIPSRTSGPET